MFTWEMNRAVESTFAVINVSNKKFHENPKLYVRKLEGSGCTYVLELFGYDDKILTETYLTQDMVDQLIMNLELAKAKAEVAQDQRFDGSDNDSAVFVNMGKQQEAYTLLTEKGLV